MDEGCEGDEDEPSDYADKEEEEDNNGINKECINNLWLIA
ncbi:uncharacterized protein FTOL_13944 [Fusarium torulosum]|uniref:Uncharacterized protein n=1 Tax=Fusarium torulosum TaxID=33205 RepID=A0AAE8MN25_9HYPO|nr:uncharacterized protein FTOL_13944 [Fusarium torulosum]